jgi:4-amino-4-deoxy-L-arabinose transferase-like glycosyltransferase
VAVVAVLLVAAAGRVAFVLATGDYGLSSTTDIEGNIRWAYDPYEHDQIALSIVGGDGFVGRLPPVNGFRAPGYPYFLAGLYELTGVKDRLEAARLVQVLLGVLTVGLLGVVARQLFDRRVALAAMVLGALYLPLVMVGASLLNEVLFVPLLLGAIAAALAHRSSRHRLRWAVLVGFLAGVAALVRSNGVLLLLPLVLLVWTGRPRLSRRALVAPAALALVAVLTIAPWTIRNAIELDRFVLVNSQAGYTLAGTYNDIVRYAPGADRGAWLSPGLAYPYRSEFLRWATGEQNGLETEDRMKSEAIDYALDRPGYVLEVGFWNTVRLLDLGSLGRSRYTTGAIGFGPGIADAGVYCFWVVGLLALLGALTRTARRAPRALWLIPLLMYLSVVFVSSSTPRMRTAIDPFLIMLAAVALTRVPSWLRSASRAPRPTLRRRPSRVGALPQ